MSLSRVAKKSPWKRPRRWTPKMPTAGVEVNHNCRSAAFIDPLDQTVSINDHDASTASGAEHL